MTVTFKCQRKFKGHCDGKDLKVVQLKSSRNVYEGPVILMCKGCRGADNGGFKYTDKELTE